MELVRIVSIGLLIAALLLLVYGVNACNVDKERGLMGMDLQCYLSIGIGASAIMIVSVSVIAAQMKKDEKKEKKPNKIEIPWR